MLGDQPAADPLDRPASVTEERSPTWLPSPLHPVVDVATLNFRSITGFLERRSLARATKAVPRTLRFVGRSLISGEVDAAVPRPALTLGLAAQVALDEAILAMVMTPSRFPTSGDYDRVSHELAESLAMYRRMGWVSEPAAYHREPPPLGPADVVTSEGRSLGTRYERIEFDSGFVPHPGEPGSDRWWSFAANHRAAATVLRHPGEPRPWVIGIHGFCMGFPVADFRGLHVETLHKDLGLNVILPVLPLHGSRRVTLISGEPFLSFELMNAVHGLTQSIWDIRRIISWLRQQGAPGISVYGVSLGGYIASLLAGLQEGLDAVVAGIPVSDFPALFHAHSPRDIRARAIEHRILGGTAEEIYQVVSPFSFAPKVPKGRRFIFAGYADRVATPGQAQRLYEHWEQPEISWYAGDHVGYLWSRQVREFLKMSLGGTSVPVDVLQG